MAKNKNLHNARAGTNDEFYTRLEDIEKECINYRKYLDFFRCIFIGLR